MTSEDRLRASGYTEVSPGVWNAPSRIVRTTPQFAGIDPHIEHTGERRLHEQIEADLKIRRWYYVHSRMDAPTTTALGTVDFIIAAPNGITYWIEAKTSNGKLTKEQNIAQHILKALNHKHFVVHSYKEYLEVVK